MGDAAARGEELDKRERALLALYGRRGGRLGSFVFSGVAGCTFAARPSSGRCRVAGSLKDGKSASLSVTSDHDDRAIRPGRADGRDRARPGRGHADVSHYGAMSLNLNHPIGQITKLCLFVSWGMPRLPVISVSIGQHQKI